MGWADASRIGILVCVRPLFPSMKTRVPLLRVARDTALEIGDDLSAQKQEGDERGDQEVAAVDGHAVEENHGHGVLQHGEGHGGEEDQHQEPNPADRVAVCQKALEVLVYAPRIAPANRPLAEPAPASPRVPRSPRILACEGYPTHPDHADIATGRRLEPQVPGLASKRPAQRVPQAVHLPSAVSPQAPSSYQSRSMRSAPQLWHQVLPPSASWTFPV